MSGRCAPKQEDWKCSPRGRAPERSFPFARLHRNLLISETFVFRVGAGPEAGFLEGGGGRQRFTVMGWMIGRAGDNVVL